MMSEPKRIDWIPSSGNKRYGLRVVVGFDSAAGYFVNFTHGRST